MNHADLSKSHLQIHQSYEEKRFQTRMHQFYVFLKRTFLTLCREKLVRVALIIIFVILSGSVAFVYFEKDIHFIDALWWSVVTLTTVGYGDISPSTAGGRIVGICVMFLGIGFLGILTAAIATFFIENKFQENRGMKSTSAIGHFIICGWNFRGSEIVEELRADPKSSAAAIVVVADIAEKPIDAPDLHFIRGEINPKILKKAKLEQAQAVIILSDDRLDSYARDAKTILNTLTIKSMNSDVYTCVELMDSKNVEHCRIAKADEIIVVGELSTNLLVQAALDHGITRMISELVSNRYGKDLFKIKLPHHLTDRTFFDVLCEMKNRYGILCLGVEDIDGENLTANPECDYKMNKDDQLIVIADQRPILN